MVRGVLGICLTAPRARKASPGVRSPVQWMEALVWSQGMSVVWVEKSALRM